MKQHLLSKGSHENVGIGRCHARAHGCTLESALIAASIRFDRMPNIGDVMKEVMIVWEGWLLLTWLFEGAS